MFITFTWLFWFSVHIVSSWKYVWKCSSKYFHWFQLLDATSVFRWYHVVKKSVAQCPGLNKPHLLKPHLLCSIRLRKMVACVNQVRFYPLPASLSPYFWNLILDFETWYLITKLFILQLMTLSDADMNQLLNHMGHTQGVHRAHYRHYDSIGERLQVAMLRVLSVLD